MKRRGKCFAVKRYEQLTKKQLIEFIKTIRPKADAYDRVCQTLGCEKDILGYVRLLKANAAGESRRGDDHGE